MDSNGKSRVASFAAMAAIVAGALTMAPAVADAPPAPFFNGFENAGDVDAGDNMTGVTRVPSGTNGVTSADGGWHAEAPAGSFTRYGGYSYTFPTAGFTTSIDIYLDTAKSLAGQDKRFDWSSAISNAVSSHRRDFIFSVGTNGTGGYVMSASNNAPGWPGNPGRDPYTITTTGWYTFAHRFYDAGAGVLAVDMSVIDAAGSVLKTWTLSDPTDVIGLTVGGNRYGWLVTNGMGNLPIDNVTRVSVPDADGDGIADDDDPCPEIHSGAPAAIQALADYVTSLELKKKDGDKLSKKLADVLKKVNECKASETLKKLGEFVNDAQKKGVLKQLEDGELAAILSQAAAIEAMVVVD